MMKRCIPILVWALLVAAAISGFATLTSRGPSLFVESYTESPQFQHHLEEQYNQLGRQVLNPIDKEEAEKKLTVSPDEIESYRTYYGTFSEQVETIEAQYEDRIHNAAAKPAVKQALTEERDGKIEKIRKNFKDDAYVKELILAEKKRLLPQLIAKYEEPSDSSAIPVAYNLTPVAGGETSINHKFAGSIGYDREFNEENGYLKITGMDAELVNEMSSGNPFNGEWENSEGIQFSFADLNAIAPSPELYKGTIIVPAAVFEKNGVLYDEVKEYNAIKIVMAVAGLVAIAALIVVLTVWKFKWSWFANLPFTQRYDSLRIDFKAGIAMILLLSILTFARNLSFRLNSMAVNGYSFGIAGGVITFLVLAAIIAFLAFQIGNAVIRYQKPGMLERDIKSSYAVQLIESMKEVFLNRSIAVQTFLLLIGFFLAGIGFVGAVSDGALFVLYMGCVLFAGLPILFVYMRRMGYLSKIIASTEDMAAGKLNQDIKVSGRSPLSKHAANLNHLRQGVEHSLSSQAKSERLKTELITNVSHDLRTPLTSIITYTDLLKKENLSDEERAEYVDVLDRKSQRLKTLIEDLFEVSKMSSGTMELNRQRIDLTQLVQQAIGEHTEGIADIPLEFRVSIPEEPMFVMLDGQRWWRMLDNLIGNALKYSLPGTRVFVSLHETNGMAEWVIKNVTAYELDENVDELYERFKRGDASRHTEGSGLGLAIAQSIADMHGGTMAIDVDGDLFKVTVRIPLD